MDPTAADTGRRCLGLEGLLCSAGVSVSGTRVLSEPSEAIASGLRSTPPHHTAFRASCGLVSQGTLRFYFYLCVCVCCVCVYAVYVCIPCMCGWHVCVDGTCGDQRKVDPLELELQVVNHQMGMLGTKLNCCVTSPAPGGFCFEKTHCLDPDLLQPAPGS